MKQQKNNHGKEAYSGASGSRGFSLPLPGRTLPMPPVRQPKVDSDASDKNMADCGGGEEDDALDEAEKP